MPQPANQNRSLVTAVPGPKSEALRLREDKHIAPGAQGYALAAGIVVDTASGTAVTDERCARRAVRAVREARARERSPSVADVLGRR